MDQGKLYSIYSYYLTYFLMISGSMVQIISSKSGKNLFGKSLLGLFLLLNLVEWLILVFPGRVKWIGMLKHIRMFKMWNKFEQGTRRISKTPSAHKKLCYIC